MVSIVIPVYNVEKYIFSCLKSIAEQSYSDYEVILVNDGSTDRSLAVIDDFTGNYPDMSVAVINQENAGVSAARNRGIAEAKGEFICFVDSDDMLDSEYLALLVAEIVDKNADIAICRSQEINEETSAVCHYRDEYHATVLSNTDMLNALLHGRVSAGIWALLCRRTILGDM